MRYCTTGAVCVLTPIQMCSMHKAFTGEYQSSALHSPFMYDERVMCQYQSLCPFPVNPSVAGRKSTVCSQCTVAGEHMHTRAHDCSALLSIIHPLCIA